MAIINKIAPAIVVGEKGEKGVKGLVSQGVGIAKTIKTWKPDPKKIKKRFVKSVLPINID